MNPPVPDERPDDFRVEYHWSEGSVSPPHHYEYSIHIGPGGRGEMVLIPDYPRNDVPRWTESFTIDAGTLNALYGVMVENGLFARTWQQMAEPPVGGSAQWMIAWAAGTRVEVGTCPVAALEDAAEAIYSAVRALIPAAVWRRMHSRYDDYRWARLPDDD